MKETKQIVGIKRMPQCVLCFIIPGYSLLQIGPFTLLMMAIYHQSEVTHEHQSYVRETFWLWDTAGPGRFCPLDSGVKCASGSLMCGGQSCAASHTHRYNTQWISWKWTNTLLFSCALRCFHMAESTHCTTVWSDGL